MKIIITFLLMMSFLAARSQAVFLKSGSIEFERSINMHKLLEALDYDFIKSALSDIEKFDNDAFVLYFDSSRVIYKPAGELTPLKFDFIAGPAKDNVVYTDWKKHEQESVKKIFEERYIVKDSSNRIKWRMTDEVRTIAGFDCRKAVGIMCDSVYITAFYTDEILASGGPESFSGLPGMILGIAIPRLYTTWFAKKIVSKDVSNDVFTVPSKGKKIDRSGLQAVLQKAFTNWGKEAERNIWWTML